MIIRRQFHPENKSIMEKFHDSGMELKPIYKKVSPSNSSSSGTSTAHDIDDLLKPIQRQQNEEEMNNQQSQSSKERTERNLWRNEEVVEMLYTMQQVKALEKLNDKTVKSENVFKDVEAIMHRNGFVKKSHVQIWTKWKFLKSTYMTSRRNGVIPRIVPPQIYEIIHQMITGLNQMLGDSCSSVDGDNSSVSGMVISGIEGAVSNEEDEDSFGMAHPIFGFRLGTVKAEPEDTGYEPTNNNASDKDPLEEELSTTKQSNEVKDEHKSTENRASKEAQPVQKVLEVPHRGRGRPPKYPPAATSTPNNTLSSGKMPPLRVAPFARTIRTSTDNATTRPPPPLTMPPAARIRAANFSNGKTAISNKFAQPKLIPKPNHNQHSPPVQPVRISKEITAQTRSSSTPSPSYPKMKQIPMRKTPYSLRPDRAIPDLEASLSPPPPAMERPSNKKLEEVATTKLLVLQSNSNNLQSSINRKRRADWPDPAPVKQPKYNDSVEEERHNSKSYNSDYDKNYGKILQNVIIDLSSSLRKMQTEMMRDFFNKQNELLEREHKFQMQQDHMIMKAFQDQTQEIMHSVKHLVGSIKTHADCQQGNRDGLRKEAKLSRKVRLPKTQAPVRETEFNQMLDRQCDEEDENEIDDDQQEYNEMEQDAEDMYTDEEQQEDQMDQEVIENNANENDDKEEQEDDKHSELSVKRNINGLSAEADDYSIDNN